MPPNPYRQKTRWLAVILVALTLSSGAAILLFPYGPDDKEAISVTHWAEYGILKMKASFVVKPGPLTPAELEDPPRFRGHFLFGAIPYHLLWLVFKHPFLALLGVGYVLVIVTFMAIKSLPGLEELKAFALLTVWACPGVLREFSSLDPVPCSFFWSLPALIWLYANFHKSPPGGIFFMSVMVAGAAMALNWTSAIALAIWSPLLIMVLFQKKWDRRLLSGFLFVGIVATAVFGFLAWDKLQMAGSTVAAGYLGGSSGYGAHASWALAFKRIVVACGIGLLPLWLFLAVLLWSRRRASMFETLVCLLPLGLSMALVLILRNYATHAQWAVAMPIALHGLVASLSGCVVMAQQDSLLKLCKPGQFDWPLAVSIACGVVYAGGFILLFSAFAAQPVSHYGYVLKHTHPHDVLLVPDYDPTFGRKSESGFLMDMTHQLTRESVSYPSPAAEELLRSGRRCFLFTKSAEGDMSAIARETKQSGPAFLRAFFAWYQQRISGQATDALRNPDHHWVLIPYPAHS